MPPTNISFATAVTISPFPCDITQTDINDTGVNYTVYYRFVAPANARVIGAWGFSGNIGTGYRPTITPYTGPAGAPVAVLGIAGQNLPIQFPVVPGVEYFLEFVKNLDDAVATNQLRVRCEVAPLAPPGQGDIIVNDSNDGFPMWVGTSTTNNQTRNFVKNMPAGEAGDILPTGRLLLEDRNAGIIQLYETTGFTSLYVSLALAGTLRIKANADRNLFYIVRYTGGQAFYRTLDALGIETAEITLTGEDAVDGICADLGNLILYLAEDGAGGAVRKWDIVTAAFLSDLAAGIADYQIPDIQALDDTSILVLYHNVVTQDINVKRYNTLGAVINTYNLGIQANTLKPRMAWAYDTPNSFWVMTHNATGASVFTNIKISDGSILKTREQQEYEFGIYNTTETPTPITRFGNSSSALFLILRIPAPPAMYVIVTNKRYDINPAVESTTGIAIPNPTFKTALMP